MDEAQLREKKRRVKAEGDLRGMIRIGKRLGDFYSRRNRLKEALSEYQEQLRVAKIWKNNMTTARAHVLVGQTHMRLGNWKEAFAHHKLHLETAKEKDNLFEQQRGLANIGRTHYCLGKTLAANSPQRAEAFSSAKSCYADSLQLSHLLRWEDVELEEVMELRSRILFDLGLILEEQKDYDRAIEHLNECAEIRAEYEFDENRHGTHTALARLHERKNEFDLALVHVDKAIDLVEPSLEAVDRLHKAELLLRSGRWADARKILVSLYVSKYVKPAHAKRAEKLLRIVVTIDRMNEALESDVDKKTRLDLYEKLGNAAAAVRSYEKSIDYYKQILIIAEDDDKTEMCTALSKIARMFRDADRFEEAIPFARRHLQTGSDPVEMCRTAVFLAEIMHRINCDKWSILPLYDFALATAMDVEDNSLEIIILKSMHDFLVSTKNFDYAREIKKTLDSFDKEVVEFFCNMKFDDEKVIIGGEIVLKNLPDVAAEIKRCTYRPSVWSGWQRRRSAFVPIGETRGMQMHYARGNEDVIGAGKFWDIEHRPMVIDNAGSSHFYGAINGGCANHAGSLSNFVGVGMDGRGTRQWEGFTWQDSDVGFRAMMKRYLDF